MCKSSEVVFPMSAVIGTHGQLEIFTQMCKIYFGL